VTAADLAAGATVAAGAVAAAGAVVAAGAAAVVGAVAGAAGAWVVTGGVAGAHAWRSGSALAPSNRPVRARNARRVWCPLSGLSMIGPPSCWWLAKRLLMLSLSAFVRAVSQWQSPTTVSSQAQSAPGSATTIRNRLLAVGNRILEHLNAALWAYLADFWADRPKKDSGFVPNFLSETTAVLAAI